MRVIVVPVKSLSKAKSRLAPVLSPGERAALTLGMFEDVLDAALGVSGWETWVVSPDEVVLEVAAGRRVRPVPEKGPPLSAAVRQVEMEATERDAAALAVVLGDLPLLDAGALGAALHTLGPVVAAPSHSEGGTNVLLRRPPRSIASRFGRGSFARHVQSARARGLPVAVVDDPTLTFDLDTAEDAAELALARRGGRAWSVCRELDVAARLASRAGATRARARS